MSQKKLRICMCAWLAGTGILMQAAAAWLHPGDTAGMVLSAVSLPVFVIEIWVLLGRKRAGKAHIYLEECLEEWKKEPWYPGLEEEAQSRAWKVVVGKQRKMLAAMPLLYLGCVLFFHERIGFSDFLLFFLILMIINKIVLIKTYVRFISGLFPGTNRLAALALSAFYRKDAGKGYIPYMKLSFQHDYNTASALYNYGMYQQAARFMEERWAALPEGKRKAVNHLLYHGIHIRCLQQLGFTEEAAQEEKQLQDYIAAHPKYAGNKYYNSFREGCRIRRKIAEKDWKAARADAEAFLKHAPENPGAYYYLWQIAEGEGNREEAQACAARLEKLGGDMEIVERMKEQRDGRKQEGELPEGT